jgi:hypothetical protein
MQEKIKKNLCLPEWVAAILDAEGEIYDGPGVAVAAMIYDFSLRKKQEKLHAIQQYRAKEAAVAYAEAKEDDKNADLMAGKLSNKSPGESRPHASDGKPVKHKKIRTKY